MLRPARRHFAALAALLVVWALAARRQTRLARGLAGGDGGREGLAALRAATTQSYTVADATASGSGLTVKYMLDFEGGERALYKPLRTNFERIGGKDVKDARHLEEPWGEVTASALARVLRLRNVPPAIIMDVPGERLAAATAPRSLRALLSRCPRYVSRDVVKRLAPSTYLDGCALQDDVDLVKGALVRWEPGFVNLARSNRWFLRGARALCGVGACPMTLKERRAWGDLEAFDAILGNYDRANNIFYRGRRLAPLDHNHVGRNLTIARIGWRWCDASPAVARIVRAAAAREVVHGGCATTDGSLFAAVACEAAPDALPEKFRFIDANAAAYAAHLASPFCRRRQD